MRSEKEITKELEKLSSSRLKGQNLNYFDFIQGAYVGLLWALELNGLNEKSRDFPTPSHPTRQVQFVKIPPDWRQLAKESFLKSMTLKKQ